MEKLRNLNGEYSNSMHYLIFKSEDCAAKFLNLWEKKFGVPSFN